MIKTAVSTFYLKNLFCKAIVTNLNRHIGRHKAISKRKVSANSIHEKVSYNLTFRKQGMDLVYENWLEIRTS